MLQPKTVFAKLILVKPRDYTVMQIKFNDYNNNNKKKAKNFL